MAKQVIGYVVTALNPGGTERLVVEMAKYFNGQTDCRVFVVCLDEPGAWAADLRIHGISVDCLWRQPGYDIAISQRLKTLLKNKRCTLLHAHQYSPWFYAAIACWMLPKVKLVFEEHGRFYPEVKKPLRKMFNRCLIQTRTQQVVAVSQDIKRRLVRYEGVAERKTIVIPNGCHAVEAITHLELDVKKQEINAPKDAFVFGSVGRLDSIKNYSLLIKAVAALKAKGLNVMGVIAGDGPEGPSLRAQIAAAHLEDSFILLGHRGDATKLMQCFDAFVLPSFSEGTSMALLEAMSCGLPIIATKVGGNPEVVENEATGWLVASDNVDELVSAMADAYGDAGKYSRLSQAARRRFFNHFTFDKMVSSYHALYVKLGERL